MDSPEAPISHHWLDSTHVSFGVMTLGYVHDRWKIEASRFNGREPDQHRYDIETGALDSSAVRVSRNPAPRWSLQASWARQVSPEQLAPGEDQTRWSASALYTRALDADRFVSLTAAWGRRDNGHEALDAWALEASVNPARSIFLKAQDCCMVAHNHQTSEHTAPTIRGVTITGWSLGCLCDLHPKYARFNKWNHGFAIVENGPTGWTVFNKRIVDGQVR
jgi:hypothetical protein